MGTSHSMLDHLRLLRQSLSFEGSNHRDFLWFHIHVTILIQLVCHFHIGCKSSLLSYYHIHIHILFRFRFKFKFMFVFMFKFIFNFKFIFTQTNLMFSIQSPVRLPEASHSRDKSFFVSYFHNSSKKSLYPCTCPCSLSFPH